MTSQQVSGVRFTPAEHEHRHRGLLGFVAFRYRDFLFDGVSVRRTRAGSLTLSYPERTDRSGHRHPILRPVNDGARCDIEKEVLGALTDLLEGTQP